MAADKYEPTSFSNLGDAIDKAGDPDAPAVIDLGGGPAPRLYSYREIDALAGATARGLLARGISSRRAGRHPVGQSRRVSRRLSRHHARRSGRGAGELEIAGSDRRVDPARLRREARAVRSGAPASLCPADLPRFSLWGKFCARCSTTGPFAAVTPHPADPAMFLYTSGSSGRPKGVVLSHHSHLWVIDRRRRGSRFGNQRVLVAAPLYHMNALAVSQAALAQHDTMILLPGFTAESYIAAAGSYRATMLTSVPTMIAMMLREKALLARTDLSAVTAVRMGSAPVSQGLMEAAQRIFPHAEITNGYGTTEAGRSSLRPPRRPPDPRSVGRRRPSARRAAAGYGRRRRGGRGRAADALPGA